MSIEKKKLVMYANYYYPELASLAQLCTDLCQGLKDEFDITVICSIPCYTGVIEDKYLTQNYFFEEYDGVKLIRVKVPRFDKQNKMSRVKNILAYFFRSVLATYKAPRADCVVTESQPPILGGLLGVAGKWMNLLRGKKSRMVYIIQDYNPEQTMVVGYSKNKMILNAMMFFDKLSCRIANKVIVVGSDMVPTMEKRFTKKDGSISKAIPTTVFINNWMDEKEVYPLPKDHPKVVEFKKQYGLDGKFVIMYSGNIGLFYDMENIFKVIGQFKDNDNVVFPFVGEGTLKTQLMEYAKEHGLKNVVFIPYQAKEDLIYSLNAADVHWVVNAHGVKGVSCPSKLYGVLAVGRPAIAVLEEGTEARSIIETLRCGYAVSPMDYDGVADLIQCFIDEKDSEELDQMGIRGRKYLMENLRKEISIKKYKDELKSC
ncbi:MAG TPA: glycosyltransferase family 4 protein [Desulfosporosinus sp.]|nr:glycosyltransferase family 4 protein [Desulfosporosinus sp.]